MGWGLGVTSYGLKLRATTAIDITVTSDFPELQLSLP